VAAIGPYKQAQQRNKRGFEVVQPVGNNR